MPQQLGTHAALRFSLPGDPVEIKCTGEIVSASEKGLGMGVRFLDLAESDRVRIDTLINKLTAP